MSKQKGSRPIGHAGLIAKSIYFLRGSRVMLDSDLAALYRVTTKSLNRAVKRNSERFPADFMFQLTEKEAEVLRCQSGTSKTAGRGGRRYLPYAFTEHGIAMLSSVLSSERAVQMNIAIMRAFLQLRAMLATHEDLKRKIVHMEKRYDARFQAIFAALREMLNEPEPPKRQIGFHVQADKKSRPSKA
jgi:ORF6N domain